MNYKYGYIDDFNIIRGTCNCDFEFKNLILDETFEDLITLNCPSCDNFIKIKKIDLLVDLRCLKILKNKLERRCFSLILDMAIYKILDYNIENFPKNIRVLASEKSFYNFELLFNESEIFYVEIINFDIIKDLIKVSTKFTISKKDDSKLKLIIKDSIYY